MKADFGQFDFLDGKLKEILSDLEEQTGVEFTMTSIYRIGDTGVHGTLPVRGVDLRMRSASVGTEVVDLVNERWGYDTERTEKSCAILHGEDSNMHLHIQSHPNTIRLY